MHPKKSLLMSMAFLSYQACWAWAAKRNMSASTGNGRDTTGKEKRYPADALAQAVRHGDLKMLRHRKNDAWELYNLNDDPGEQVNLAHAHPDIVAKLDKWIFENRTEMLPQIEPEKPVGKNFSLRSE